METHAQQADHGKPDRDQQALDQLQYPDPGRRQHTHHIRDVDQAAMRNRIGFALVVIIVALGKSAEAGGPEPDGYRLENYRAPTPATLQGARVVGTDEAEKLWRDHSASFVDVLP